jgi:hypothetical protein
MKKHEHLKNAGKISSISSWKTIFWDFFSVKLWGCYDIDSDRFYTALAATSGIIEVNTAVVATSQAHPKS